MQELHRSVVVQAALGPEIEVQLVEEALVDAGQRKIARLVVHRDEVHHPVLAHLVAEEALVAVVLSEHQLLVIIDEEFKELADAHIRPFVSGAESHLDLAGTDDLAGSLQIVVVSLDRSLHLVQSSVDHLLFFCLGGGPVSGTVPVIRKHILLGGDMDRFFVDCQPAQDRGLALRIAAGSLNKERGVKCSSHDSSY